MQKQKSFTDMINEIADTGMSYTQIGAKIGCSAGNVRFIAKNEKQVPGVFVADKIRILHKQVCGRKAKK